MFLLGKSSGVSCQNTKMSLEHVKTPLDWIKQYEIEAIYANLPLKR